MARSHGRSSRERPKRPLLSLFRESGDVLEAESPTFDIAVAAPRLREAAEGGGILQPGGSSAGGLRDTGADLEEVTPPFDVESGATRLQERALARGLLGGNEPAEFAPAGSVTTSPEQGRFKVQEPEGHRPNLGQDDRHWADRLTVARAHFAKSVHSKMHDLGEPMPAGQLVRMGWLTDEDIGATLDHYVRPDRFTTASSALRVHRVVALSGAAGCGKRTGAVALLREVTDKSLVILSPAISLRELATYEYRPGFGYILLNWQDDQPQEDNSQLFYWHGVREQLAEANAFLIVTAKRWLHKEEAVPHFRWVSPSPRELLSVYLNGANAESHLNEIIGKLPDQCEASFVVTLARSLVAGTDLNAALRTLQDDTAEQIRSWFHDRPLDDILAVTVLAFTEGQDERVFLAMLRLLRESAEHAGLIDMRAERRGVLSRAAAERLQADGLITRIQASAAGADLTLLSFRMPSFRRLILAHLYASFESPFWDTVRQWLTSVIQLKATEPSVELQLAVAGGLADLALIDMDQVVRAYLNPGATGEFGWVGQMISTYALWWMSFEDTLAPSALRIVKLWVNSTDTPQMWTAAMALSGDLGAAYPAEALQSLWRIIIARTELLSTDAIWALAQLFATLVSNGQNTDPLLRLLYEHLNNRSLSRMAESAVLMVLSIRDPQSGLPVAALSIQTNRMSQIPLARLWARALDSTSGSRQALTSLTTVLAALEQISAAPSNDLQKFGNALSRELSPRGQQMLIRALADWQAGGSKSQPSTAVNITSLISDLEHR